MLIATQPLPTPLPSSAGVCHDPITVRRIFPTHRNFVLSNLYNPHRDKTREGSRDLRLLIDHTQRTTLHLRVLLPNKIDRQVSRIPSRGPIHRIGQKARKRRIIHVYITNWPTKEITRGIGLQ
jgi:hypothetical protein